MYFLVIWGLGGICVIFETNTVDYDISDKLLFMAYEFLCSVE